MCCGLRFQARFAVLVPLKYGFMCGLRFRNFSGRGLPQISMRFAVLDEISSFWLHFWKALLPRAEETTYKNACSMV